MCDDMEQSADNTARHQREEAGAAGDERPAARLVAAVSSPGGRAVACTHPGASKPPAGNCAVWEDIPPQRIGYKMEIKV